MVEDLAHAARMLSQAAERLTTNIESSPSTSQPAVATAATNNGPGRFQRQSSTLFPHHFQSTGSRSASFNKPQRSVKRKASETTTKTKRKEIIRKFVCLSDKEQLETPDAEKQRELLMVGLGETKISIAEEASELEIRDRVLENFPQLQAAGGFDLMYAEPRKRDLHVIPPGPNGVTMKYLATFIGQGKIFVRPIQVDLAMESDTPKKNMEIQKEKCKRCEAILDVYVLREHYATCSRQVNSAQVSL